MNNEFYNSFINARNNEPNSKMLIEFNLKRDYLNEDNYISFIEGPDDKKFYRFIKNHEIINKIDKDNYIYSNNDLKEINGKKGVITMYKYIDSNFPSYLDKCIFLVDHDYNGLEGYNLVKDSGITTTKGYAIENYFFTKDNIQKIFNYLKLDDYYLEFDKKLKMFLYDILEFTRLKSTITNNRFIRVKNIYSNKEIFKFDFKNNNYFDKNIMYQENQNMLNEIKKNNRAFEYYKTKSYSFTNNPLWARGHDIYNFLYEYLKQVHNKNINEFNIYKDLVKILDIDITIKDGMGNILN